MCCMCEQHDVLRSNVPRVRVVPCAACAACAHVNNLSVMHQGSNGFSISVSVSGPFGAHFLPLDCAQTSLTLDKGQGP